MPERMLILTLDYSWCILQTAIGLLLAAFNLIGGARSSIVPGHCIIVEDCPLMPARTGVSLGRVLLGGKYFQSWSHEYGHSIQSRLLGPLYLFVIGIPSLWSVAFRPDKHSQFYTERWADRLAPKYAQLFSNR